MEKEKKPEFVVTDRRKFNVNGEPRPEAAAEGATEAATPAQTATPAASSAAGKSTPPPEAAPVTPKAEPAAKAGDKKLVSGLGNETGYDGEKERSSFGGRQMDFMDLLDMLVQTAMVYAGAMETGTERRVDIVGLRQMIDLISVLEAKTKGNLSEQERAVLTNTIFQLRMTYMEIVNMIGREAMQKAPGAPGAPRK